MTKTCNLPADPKKSKSQKLIILLISFCSLFSILEPNMASADSSLENEQLLQYFSAGCASQGKWTSAAEGYASNLINTLKSLSQDPDCRTLNGALGTMESISAAVAALSEDQNARVVNSLQQQEQNLLQQIAQTTDPTALASLVANLQTTEVQAAQYQSYQNSDSKYSSTYRKGQALQTLVSGTNRLLQQATQNLTCIQKNSSLLTGLAGLAGSVEAVTMTGTSSLIAAAGVGILNGIIENIRLRKLNQKINAISSAVSASAYKCVLETLGNQWCAAQDGLDVLRLEADALVHPQAPSELQNGINLLNQDTNVFLTWLDAVRAGTVPTNSATAQNQAVVLQRDEMVRAGQANGSGIISQYNQVFAKTVGEDNLWAIEQNAIAAVVSSLTTSTYSTTNNIVLAVSPFSDVLPNSAVTAPWYLIGVSSSSIPVDGSKNLRPLSYYSNLETLRTDLGNPNFHPDLSFLRVNMNSWIALAASRVRSETSTTINLDPRIIINQAATTSLNGNSPYLSIQKFIKFLQSHKGQNPNIGTYDILLKDTIARLQAISCDIEAVMSLNQRDLTPLCAVQYPAPSADPAAALADIYSQGYLDNGNGFLGDRLLLALRLALNTYVTNGTSVEAPLAAQLIAGNDIIAGLQAITPSQDYNRMGLDMQNSQTVLERVTDSFADLFGQGIYRSILDFNAQSLELSEGPNGPSQQSINELCLKLLSVPQWPAAVPESVCYGRTLKSVAFKEGPISETISPTLIHSPYASRACKFRDYSRRNSIYQTYNGGAPKTLVAPQINHWVY